MATEITSENRVRENTSQRFNAEIDKETLKNVHRYASLGQEAIDQRIAELDKEWDIERLLELNAAAIAFAGTFMAGLGKKRYMFLPGLVTAFLAQHAIQGWCPPLPVLRALGFRTRSEISREKYALKVLREDS